MANNDVFANGLEIACKVADGVSSCAFPDPCWTPHWAIVAYANTAYAIHTANGSKSVLIGNKQIIKKDVSYIKTSTGNELAKGRKGQLTGVKKGKAYFTSWSMNVFVEGKNVCRHTDKMTHNHGSSPGNTGLNIYIDTENKLTCAQDARTKEEKCAISKKEQSKHLESGLQRNIRRAKQKPKKPALKVRERTWKDKHCYKALMNFEKLDEEELLKNIEEATQEMDKLVDDLLSTAGDKTLGLVKDKAMTKLMATGGCGAAGAAAGAAIGVWFFGVGALVGAGIGAAFGAATCNAISVAVDVAEGLEAGWKMWNNKDEISHTIDKIKSSSSKFDDVIDAVTEPDEALKKEKFDKITEDIREDVKNDPCLQAKRCILVPHTRKDGAVKTVEKGKSSIMDRVFKNDEPQGCCSGQTGHHLIYNKMVDFGKNCDKASGKTLKIGQGKGVNNKFVEGAAPTVCTEGQNQHQGTHKTVHDLTDKNVQKMMDGKYEDSKGKVICTDFSLDCAIEAAAQAHADQWPEANCNKKCIAGQLDAYYSQFNCKTDPVDKQGKAISKTGNTDFK